MEERRREILQELEQNGKVRVIDLSKRFGCSEVTIRTDIKSMEMEGLLNRVHGGALKLDTSPVRRYTAESVYRYTERKKRIAAKAYDYIKDRDTIIIDDASSSFYLAVHMKQHAEKRVAVVTNSLLVGNELAGVTHVDLYLVGGHVGGHLAATMGDAAVQNMSSFHVDKAFIGVHGINFEAGLTSVATPQMQVKHAILKVAGEVYVLADSSKFGGGYLSVICPIDAVHKIITDHEVSPDNIRLAAELKVPLVIA